MDMDRLSSAPATSTRGVVVFRSTYFRMMMTSAEDTLESRERGAVRVVERAHGGGSRRVSPPPFPPPSPDVRFARLALLL